MDDLEIKCSGGCGREIHVAESVLGHGILYVAISGGGECMSVTLGPEGVDALVNWLAEMALAGLRKAMKEAGTCTTT